MKCMDCRKLMPAYLKDQMEQSIGREIEEHIKLCSACKLYLDQERALDKKLDNWQLKVKIDLTSTIMDEINKSQKPKLRAKRYSFIQDLMAAAAAAIIVFSTANMAAPQISPPDYSSTIGSFSKGVGEITNAYINISSNTIDGLIDSLRNNQVLKGDEKR